MYYSQSVLEKAGVVERPASGFDIDKFTLTGVARLMD